MHRFKPQSLTFKQSLLIGLTALSLVACGGGGGSDDADSKLNLSLLISGGIKSSGLMLKNVASGADNTPFAIAKTTASTLDISNKIAKGSDYDIKVAQQPEGFGQFCYIEQGKGTFTNTDIAIQLKCVAGAAKVSTYAGIKGSSGNTNGSRLSAKFSGPTHMVFDSKGNFFIADYSNNQIRKITPQGVVSLFAGNAGGASGTNDGTGAVASFNDPWTIAVDKDDNLYVGDNQCVRKITPQAVVTTLAGLCGTSGNVPTNFTSNTTTGADARFGDINGMVYDGDNALYVLDYDNQLIRKISINSGTSATARVQNIIATGSGNVSMGLSADKKSLYYIPQSDYKLYQVDLTSTAQPKPKTALTTTAGSGFVDGNFSVAQFNPGLNQIIASKSGQFLYLVGRYTNRIRRIDLNNEKVSTLAGSGTSAVTDGIGINAAFSAPDGIAQDAQGNLFVSSYAHVIRKLELVKKP